MAENEKIVIVGGGASGLAAAVFAAQRIGGERVILIEKQSRVGKKLLATGNGTCNLSNIHADVSRYHGSDPSFARSALSRFSPYDTMAFFDSIGLRTVVREDGRVYPLCAQASAVLDCLRMALERQHVDVRCDCSVESIEVSKRSVRLKTTAGTVVASKVLIAAGGMASASLGGSTDGYTLLCGLGHEKTPLFPSIVQIRTERDAVKAVKGIRVDATLALKRDGKTVASSRGEILFADYGISGPAAMFIGRYAADWERRKSGEMTMQVDVLPTVSYDALRADLVKRCAFPGMTLENMLVGLLQKRLGQTLVKAADLMPLSRTVDTLTEQEIDRLCRTIKGWTLCVVGTAGMNAAQVTAGGIATKDFDPVTLRSHRWPNVYAAGEVLDIDGDCGGLNLQWAWSSAYAAAMAMTEDWV